MIKRAATLIGVMALVWAAGPAAAADELRVESVDVGSYPEVSVTITVPGEIATDELTPEDFAVVVGGAPVAATIWALRAEPLEVVLLVDTSGSMQGEAIAAAREAGAAFIDRLPDNAAVAVAGFGPETTILSEFTTDRAASTAAVSQLEASGETALFDAVGVATSLFDPASPARRFVVLLSDGGDTVSEATLFDARSALTSSGVGLYAVRLPSEEGAEAPLASLAAAAAGRVVEADDTAALTGIYDDIAVELVSQYRLTFLTELNGETDLQIAVGDEVAFAVANLLIPLPAAPPVPVVPEPTITSPEPSPGPAGPPATAAPAVAAPAPGALGGTWTLPAGVALIFVSTVLGMFLLHNGRAEGPSATADLVSGDSGRVKSITNRATKVADRVLGSGGRQSSLDKRLDRAGVALRPEEFAVGSAAAGVTLVAGALLVFGGFVAIVSGVFALVAPRLLLTYLAARRRNAFADQLEAALQMISGSLRSGYGLLQAVTTVSSEAPAPTAEEFDRIVVETRLGRPLTDSLRALSERMQNEDMRWVVEAIDIQQSVGGDLAEVLETVGTTIRDRNQIRRQVKALSAEGRMSATILIALPFGLAALIGMVSPEYLGELTGSALGRGLIVAALLLIGAGSAWIRRIVKVVF